MLLVRLSQLERLVREHVPEEERTALLSTLDDLRTALEVGVVPPDWEDIPKEFTFRGMDSAGNWYAFTHPPLENSVGYQRLVGTMRFIRATSAHNWRKTLGRRP